MKQVWSYIFRSAKPFPLSIFIMFLSTVLWSMNLSVKPYLLRTILNRLADGSQMDIFHYLAVPIALYLFMYCAQEFHGEICQLVMVIGIRFTQDLIGGRKTEFFWIILHELQQMKKVTIDVILIDSSSIPIHRHGSGALKNSTQVIGRGQHGLSTKMHLAVSSTGV